GLRRQPDLHHHAGRGLARGRRPGGRGVGGGGHDLHLHQRDGEPHDRGHLRDRHPHHHGLGREQRQHQPVRRGGGERRGQPELHHLAGRQLPRGGRAGGRGLGGGGDELHLHQRDGQPHHRRQLRDRHPDHHGVGGGQRRDQPLGRGDGGLRRQPDLHHHAGRALSRGRRPGGRGVGGGGHDLHVHQRDGEPHHRSQLRDHHTHHHDLGRE